MNTLPHDTSHYDRCRTDMQNLRKSHSVRSFLLCIFALLNGYAHIITMPIVKGIEETPETSYSRIAIFTNGFGYAVLALFLLIIVTVLGFLLDQKRGKLLLIPTLLSLISVITGLFHPIWGTVITVLLAIGLWESRKAVWLTQQDGYPYFNERMTEQASHFNKEYDPLHPIRPQADTQEMPELGDARDAFNSQEVE